jgi:hypothetical protein
MPGRQDAHTAGFQVEGRRVTPARERMDDDSDLELGALEPVGRATLIIPAAGAARARARRIWSA